MEREGFYRRVLRSLVEQGLVERDWRVLIVAGSDLDRDAFAGAGFTDVTITNLDPGPGEERQDAEELSYEDGSFDLAVVSAGLHHCASPHRAVLELYRVARHGLLALEARDSVLMRLALRAGVIDEYEMTAVAAHDFTAGGVRNSATPNYVYRWTEREVEKMIASAAPYARHKFVWFHELELPVSVLEASGRGSSASPPCRSSSWRRSSRSRPTSSRFAVFKDGLQPWMQDAETPDVAAIQRRLGG